MTKTTAQRATATDPEIANLFKTAPLADGAGASEGGVEMEDGEVAGDGEEDEDGGDGGEIAMEGDGVVSVGGVAVELEGEGAETGVFVTGDGGEAVGADAGGGVDDDGGDFVGDEAGEDDGD